MRAMMIMHMTAFVNSAAHMFGDKPYNDKLASVENPIVSLFAIGEGYHNYHHAYPYDYATGETGNYFNLSKWFIDFMFVVGQAYNLKQASRETIEKSKKRMSDIKIEKKFPKSSVVTGKGVLTDVNHNSIEE